MSISKIHGRLLFLCILPNFGPIFGEKRALGPPRATPGDSRAVPWASAGAFGRLPGRSGKPFGMKKWFGEILCFTEVLPISRGLPGAQKPLRAPPAPFGTCHDAIGTCFVARAKCKKSRNFGKCVTFLNFPEKNADFHANLHFFDEIPRFLASDFRGNSGRHLLRILHRNSGTNLCFFCLGQKNVKRENR